MKVTFAPRGRIEIDDATIIYKNFRGEGSDFNHEGDRNFAWRIYDEDLADRLVQEGWNVKRKPPKNEGDGDFLYLPVKVKFNGRGPNIYLIQGKARHKLTEEKVHRLDNIYIDRVDMDIRPYDWEIAGKSGRTAYLEAMEVTQHIDRFEERMAEEEYPEED